MKNVNTLKYLFLLFIIILLTPINSLAIETISFLRTGMSTYEIENEIENIKPHGNEKKENPDIYNMAMIMIRITLMQSGRIKLRLESK